MAKQPKMPSKAQMDAQDRQWRAERVVMDKLAKTPEVKKEIRRVAKELAQVEAGVKVPGTKK